MLKKQTNTLKMMFHYRLKEFDQVDSCLDNCLYLDPQSVSMALARLHVIDPEGKKLEKFFQRRKKRFKGDDGAFIASVYAWIMVKRGNSDSAIKALSDCTKYSDHPSLEENLDKLRNGKLKQFSNSSFGDMWYALLLEEPKMKVMRQERMY